MSFLFVWVNSLGTVSTGRKRKHSFWGGNGCHRARTLARHDHAAHHALWIGMAYDLPNGVVVEGIDVLAAGQRILERWLALVLSDYLDSLLLGNFT